MWSKDAASSGRDLLWRNLCLFSRTPKRLMCLQKKGNNKFYQSRHWKCAQNYPKWPFDAITQERRNKYLGMYGGAGGTLLFASLLPTKFWQNFHFSTFDHSFDLIRNKKIPLNFISLKLCHNQNSSCSCVPVKCHWLGYKWLFVDLFPYPCRICSLRTYVSYFIVVIFPNSIANSGFDW